MVASSLDLDDFTNTLALPEKLLDWFTVDYDESKAPEEQSKVTRDILSKIKF